MLIEAKEKALLVGFLDPQLLSVTAMEFDRSSMVDYVTKGLRIFGKKEYIMFGHNIGGHWILVVIIPSGKRPCTLIPTGIEDEIMVCSKGCLTSECILSKLVE